MTWCEDEMDSTTRGETTMRDATTTSTRETTAAPAPLPACLSPDQAAAYLALPVKSVRTLLRRRELRGALVGRRWRIRREDLDRLFGDEREAAPVAFPPLPDAVADARRPGRPRKIRRRSAALPDAV
jgi:excisionase family DNA binding protein